MAASDKGGVSYDHKLTLAVDLATKVLPYRMCLSKEATFLLPIELNGQLKTFATYAVH